MAVVTELLEPAVGDLLGHEDARHRAQVWPRPAPASKKHERPHEPWAGER